MATLLGAGHIDLRTMLFFWAWVCSGTFIVYCVPITVLSSFHGFTCIFLFNPQSKPVRTISPLSLWEGQVLTQGKGGIPTPGLRDSKAYSPPKAWCLWKHGPESGGAHGKADSRSTQCGIGVPGSGVKTPTSLPSTPRGSHELLCLTLASIPKCW